MELILINSSKLKIMLTSDDMAQYKLDCDIANYDNTETRRAFWNILDEAKHRTGFDAASDRVFIQLYPSKEGGCEMYVTKVGIAADPNRKLLSPINCGPTKLLPDGKPESIRLSFMFPDIGQMIAACRLASRSGQICQSNAWIDEHGFCYLFAESDGDDINAAFLFGIMNEFGSPVENPNIPVYISEHGRAFCLGNAVETLSVL